MKMNEVKSITWRKLAEIPTDDFSITGITSAICKEFGEMLLEDVEKEIANGYIEIADDGIIVWQS